MSPKADDHGADDKTDQLFRTIVLVAVTVIIIATAFAYYRKVGKGSSAFLRWRPQVAELVRGEDVYALHKYPNPPIMGMTLYPLAALPAKVGAMTFFAIKVAMAALSVTWCLRLAGGHRGRWPWLWIGVVILLGLRTIMSDLQHGNVNIVILFLVVGCAYAWRQGRDVVAGLALALAVAFKVTPALLVVYFAWKRQWKLVAAAVAGMVLFLLVVPSLVLGPARNWERLNGWADVMVWPYAKTGLTTYTIQINQSIPGLFQRLCTECDGIKWKSGEFSPVNILSLGPQTARWTLKAILLGLVAMLAWLCRTPTTDRRDWRLAAEIGLVLIGMLWLSERSWKHHHVTMLLPFACIVAGVTIHTLATRTKKLLAGLLVGSLALVLTTTEVTTGWLAIDAEGNWEGHKYLLAYGAFFASVAAIFTALGIAVRTAPPAEETAPLPLGGAGGG